MDKRANILRIGAFAEAAGVSVETIRFYQRKGLLLEPDKPPGGIRHYSTVDVARVRFIKCAQRLGFSLNEVASLIAVDDGSNCDKAREIGAAKLADVRAQLANLHCIESELANLVHQCCVKRHSVSCPLISAMQKQK
ncbi:MerR family transcriptional regulator [Variovorax humicola]|uniref:Mercuric resistance operon regulatory protein n=1 Tax=Variovorax humicola TaxID=1769758 RepID=A0ABU8W4H7_9BURK